MLKVLIVDDEYIIREGLKTIIDWNSLGFEVCDTALNGREGLQKAEQHMPDLVIVDIKMPVMDGLAMVEKMKAKSYGFKIIILSAHSDFGLAQKSIELGIESYVLKPVEQTDLIEKVSKVKAQIEVEKEARKKINDSIMLCKEKILEGFVTGLVPESMLEQYKNNYGLDFPWKKYQLGLIVFDKENTLSPKIRSKIKELVESFIRKSSYGYVFDIDGHIGILFRNLSEIQLPRVLMRLQNLICSENCVTVTISVGNSVKSLGKTSHSYHEAKRLLEQKFLLGHKHIIFGGEFNTGNGSADKLYTFNMEEVLNNLRNAVDINHAEQINDSLEVIKDYFLKNKLDEKMIKISYTELYLSLINGILASEESLKEYIPDNREVLVEISKKTSLQELHGYMKLQLFTLSEQLCCNRPSSTIKRILDYIDRNYGSDLKLDTLAKVFSYNSCYLGKLFKSQTGQSFNAYLDRVRMENAKELLGKGLKICQVVEKVGIHDIDYFYRKFKKYTGVSPSIFKGKT